MQNHAPAHTANKRLLRSAESTSYEINICVAAHTATDFFDWTNNKIQKLIQSHYNNFIHFFAPLSHTYCYVMQEK